jgi:hypothetical protein
MLFAAHNLLCGNSSSNPFLNKLSKVDNIILQAAAPPNQVSSKKENGVSVDRKMSLLKRPCKNSSLYVTT